MNTHDKIWFHLDSSLPTGSIVKRENPCKSPLSQSQQVTTIPDMSHDLQIKGRKKMQTRTVVEVASNMCKENWISYGKNEGDMRS